MIRYHVVASGFASAAVEVSARNSGHSRLVHVWNEKFKHCYRTILQPSSRLGDVGYVSTTSKCDWRQPDKLVAILQCCGTQLYWDGIAPS